MTSLEPSIQPAHLADMQTQIADLLKGEDDISVTAEKLLNLFEVASTDESDQESEGENDGQLDGEILWL